jgi:hypothetical protein
LRTLRQKVQSVYLVVRHPLPTATQPAWPLLLLLLLLPLLLQ